MARCSWPMALARTTVKAVVEYVPAGQNRGARSVVGIKLRCFCDSTRFRIVGY